VAADPATIQLGSTVVARPLRRFLPGLPLMTSTLMTLERVGKVIIARVYDLVQGPAGGS
jgi:hypothetical protein